MPLSDIYKGYKAAVGGLRTQSASERDRVMRAYDEQRGTLQRQLSNTERDMQRALGSIRTAERKEQRKRDLPITRPRDLGTAAKLADVRKQGEGIQRNIRDAQSRIAQARGESLADLERQVQRERDRLSAWYRDAKSAQREYEAEVKTEKIAVASTPFAGAKASAGVGSATPSFTGAKAKAGKADTAQTMAEVMTPINLAVAQESARAIRKSQSASGAFTGQTVSVKPKSILGTELAGPAAQLAGLSQSELKVLYDKEQALPMGLRPLPASWTDESAPLWQKLLMYDSPRVIKHGDTYYPLAAGDAPAVAMARPTPVASSQRLSASLKTTLGNIVNSAIRKSSQRGYNPNAAMKAVTAAQKARILSHSRTAGQTRAQQATAQATANRTFASYVNDFARRQARHTTPVAVDVAKAKETINAVSATGNAAATREVVAVIATQLALRAGSLGMTMPEIKQATQAAIEQMTIVTPQTSTATGTWITSQQATAAKGKTDAKSATVTEEQIVTKADIKQQPSLATSTKSVTELELAIQPVTEQKVTTKVGIDTLTTTAPKVKTPPLTSTRRTITKQPFTPRGKGKGTIKLPMPGGTSVGLTPEQYAGIVAWRQGMFYIIVYPPYTKAQIVYTRKPVPGISYAKGPQSPQKSAGIIGGKLPKSFEVAMGISKVKISPVGIGKAPRLEYSRRKIKVTPGLGEVRPGKKDRR